MNGGWLPRTPLKWLAVGGEQVWSDQVTEALASLAAEGLIRVEARHRKRGAGLHGPEVLFYKATVTTVADPTLSYPGLVTTLALCDRLTLLSCAHKHAELEVAEGRPGAWLRISQALQASERAAAGVSDGTATDHPGGPAEEGPA